MNDIDTPAEPRWLSDTEQHAWRVFLRMQGQLITRLGRELQADSDLSIADYDVLVHLTDLAGGRRRILELARELDWEKSRMSHHLARMAKRGLIAREECPADGRGAFIAITPAGQAAIEEAAPRHVELVRRMVFDALTPEQVAALGTVSEQILKQLDAPQPSCEG
ncbi:MarR family winged helix-turn-helix transcriptional regulator [Streptacidiphilus carbonis]|jgi:DNA-binding MarR family transcriptional regulator|uniref:MarR family winged helix-turn-helix transcriptional regulator n=1 Tax=Streptacidiphilus carbonis TaxID=105422 RepID=UPI0005A68AA3|nr:MarR family winged helix-turn-helix transcriptional regulator [Streptacidiphilus carbonis]